jgi:HTH-type transcriptional regulator / antitoxin HipB
MISFRDYLETKLKDKEFAKEFYKELHAVRLAIEIAQARESQGMTQSDLASKAHITQQQLSKVENAKACKVETLFKVCDALGMDLVLRPRKGKAAFTRKQVSRNTLRRRRKTTAKRSLHA